MNKWMIFLYILAFCFVFILFNSFSVELFGH